MTIDPEILTGLPPRLLSAAYRTLGSVTDAEDEQGDRASIFTSPQQPRLAGDKRGEST